MAPECRASVHLKKQKRSPESLRANYFKNKINLIQSIDCGLINTCARNRETRCSVCGLTVLLFRTAESACLRCIYSQSKAGVIAGKLAITRSVFRWSWRLLISGEYRPTRLRAVLPIACSFFMTK